MQPSKYLAIYEGIEARTGACRTQTNKYIAGEKLTKRRKDKDNEEGLVNLYLGYLHKEPVEFIRGVAHRIGMHET